MKLKSLVENRKIHHPNDSVSSSLQIGTVMITAYPRKEHHTGKEEEKLFQDPLRIKLQRV